ncbi:putative T6SS immunity periplasmic lipoprotein [Serratia sp. (in: enterobacteria)]|uniref:putative T6SS immunity periplasmic lipoprotein n=1 Tax=Serratia sp. (in: enterobacteria) TaxID=616 RepID=UPI00398A1EB4
MRKYLCFILPLFLSGCPMGDKINLYPARSMVVNGKICVFFDKTDIVKDENILKVAIWKYGNETYAYETSYATAPLTLEAGKCIPGIGEFDFIPGEAYSVLVDTPLHSYETRFSVSQQGENITLNPN